ncbi:MAG TPA: hypothetical protein VNM40_04220 [Candidatus Paceibacterota bacterium]|nr:hypothetical protein [Candidatus Paceibacterota bacterium]
MKLERFSQFEQKPIEKAEVVIGNALEFLRLMQESAKNTSEEDIERTLFSIEAMTSGPDPKI